jgi:carbamoyl-phosphate synthase small subunit
MSDLKKVWIYLENGTFLEANSFGASGTKVGEIVFNTSMSGYQEIMSDASYAGQFVLFTMPEIGNVGCNDDDMESAGVYASGMVVRNYQDRYSNFRSQKSLGDFLKEHDSFGITNVDTRGITKMLRDSGSQMMIASTEISNRDELKKLLESAPRIEDVNYIKEVSTKEVYEHNSASWDPEKQTYKEPLNNGKKIVVIDFGVKRNILNELRETGLSVEVIPHTFKAEDLIDRFHGGEIDGVFLSNGPGDPLVLHDEAREVKKLIEAKIPMFAICLGHQLLSIAHGYDTYKLKFGHHGGNHPVMSEKDSSVEITAQNHNYNVPESISAIAKVTHKNLFDGTIEGITYNDGSIFSVQHHPEASPGPHDSKYIFKEFSAMLK